MLVTGVQGPKPLTLPHCPTPSPAPCEQSPLSFLLSHLLPPQQASAAPGGVTATREVLPRLPEVAALTALPSCCLDNIAEKIKRSLALSPAPGRVPEPSHGSKPGGPQTMVQN